MIGRDGPVKTWELVRWARAQGKDPRLSGLAKHLLLMLATYCDKHAVCNPSLETLTEHTGKGRRAVVYALRQLESVGLVWTEQRGRGRSAQRELLFNPERGDSLTKAAMRPEAGSGNTPAVQPVALQADERQRASSATSGTQQCNQLHPELPENSQTTSTPRTSTSELPDDAVQPVALHPTRGRDDRENDSGLRPLDPTSYVEQLQQRTEGEHET